MKMQASILLIILVLVLVLGIAVPGRKQAALHAETAPRTIYFAGGCFWGVEHMMALVPGVINARSGYANGTVENPDYQTVVSGATGHRETVEVTYNPDLVTLEELVGLFFSAIDPTVKNRQGNDIGTQYQTGIYYQDEADGQEITRLSEAEKGKHSAFFVEVAPLTAFYEAEDYHQDYLIKNPGGYCHLTTTDFDRARETGRKPEPRKAEYRRITPQDAKANMDAGTAIIIVDVREPYEFAAGHIEGAINLPLGSLTQLAKENLPDKDARRFPQGGSGSSP